MKRFNFIQAVILSGILLVTGLVGCKKDTTVVVAPYSTVTTPVSFASQLIPLFASNCALSGCHVTTGGHAPDLTAMNAYNSLMTGGFINTTTPSASIIYLRLTSQISPGMPLTAPGSDPGGINELTVAWIKQGAKNN